MASVERDPTDEEKRKAKCPGCLCVIRYVPNEVMNRTFSDYGGGSDTHWWVVCPNSKCGKEVPVRSCW